MRAIHAAIAGKRSPYGMMRRSNGFAVGFEHARCNAMIVGNVTMSAADGDSPAMYAVSFRNDSTR